MRLKIKTKKIILDTFYSRNKSGASLAELMMACLILGVCTAAIAELMTMTTMSATKLSSQEPVTNAFRNSTARISTEVRSAYGIGDCYGGDSIAGELGFKEFPAPDNLRYGSNGAAEIPTPSWPESPWSSNGHYRLGPNLLIVQTPVLFQAPDTNPLMEKLNGQPIIVPANFIKTEVPSRPIINLDTTIFAVVTDLEKPGEYILQMARFPGVDVSGINTVMKSAVNPPQTIAKGIVGPRSTSNPDGAPEVFSYFVWDSGAMKRKSLDDITNYRSIVGVGIDLEIRDQSPGQSHTRALRTFTFLNSSRNLPFEQVKSL